MVIQQVEGVFNIISTNLRAWLNIFVLGTNGLCAERRKSRWLSTEDDCTANLSQNKRFPAGILTGQMWLRCTYVPQCETGLTPSQQIPFTVCTCNITSTLYAVADYDYWVTGYSFWYFCVPLAFIPSVFSEFFALHRSGYSPRQTTCKLSCKADWKQLSALNLYIRTVHLDNITVYYSPTDAQLIVLKSILKFTLK